MNRRSLLILVCVLYGGVGSGFAAPLEDRSQALLWAVRPIERPAIPPCENGDWCRSTVDEFVLARLEAAGLSPAPEASRATLLRRLKLDLVGLPPTANELRSFEADRSEDAYERLVDRLLASPLYGERWGRHWLDLVRYAESDGFRADDYRPHAWRYRDYVIDSLNADVGFPLFVEEQLAGDELHPDRKSALIATGFLRHWPYEHNQRDLKRHRDEILTDVTDITADVFLGMSLRCARCHDHKFDPIPQRDHFRLRAYF
ncbi:MAG: DUF1549 domain-containing protein, partial [Planctomycetota bacterium]